MKNFSSYIILVVSFALFFPTLSAQEKPDTLAAKKDTVKAVQYSDTYLDTVKLNRRFVINDYSMIGVEYGASLSRMSFNPTKTQSFLFVPGTFGIYYTRYGKMFGYLPYFGLKTGLRYSHEGYKFKENKQNGTIPSVEGATQAVMDVAEVPMMAHFHMDMLHFKVMADAGIYGGYRLNIERTGPNVADSIKTSFLSTDRRFDFGLCGGVGFGIVFDPVEFQVNANVRYSWGTLYDPDYSSKDYYKFAYPFDVMVTAGLYFQLTRRTGKTKPQLRREAYEEVYKVNVPEKNANNGNPGGESR